MLYVSLWGAIGLCWVTVVPICFCVFAYPEDVTPTPQVFMMQVPAPACRAIWLAFIDALATCDRRLAAS